jgi:hypothetical protein
MPWLHLLFDAWEDYKRSREREAAERDAAVEHEALVAAELGDGSDDPDDDDDHRKDKNKDKDKKKKRRKDKK